MTVAIKERPILMNAAMVRATLDGRKTQTRRIIKPQPESIGNGDWRYGDEVFISDEAMKDHLFHNVYGAKGTPYGSVYEGHGERLWVRETFCQKSIDGYLAYNKDGYLDPSCYWYRADGQHVIKDDGDGGTEFTKEGYEASPWKPSIHMPRAASRITLEITDVRVERLNDISIDDSKAEGVMQQYAHEAADAGHGHDSRGLFKQLWESVNGPDSWAANPWLWVIAFRRIEA